LEPLGRAITTITAAILIVAILVVGLAAGLTVLSLGHGGTSSITTVSKSHSLLSNSSTSASSTSPSSSNSSMSSNSSNSISLSSTTISYSSPNSNIVYIPTSNSKDGFDYIDIYTAIDSNTGTLGWVAQTSQDDSLYTVSNNQLFQFKSNLHQTPTGLTFDPKNNLAYLTTVSPGGGPARFYAISGNKFVNTPISSNLQSSPQTLAYDLHFDYLYVSVAPQAMTSQTETGIEVFNSSSGSRLTYIPTGFINSFAYDSSSGDMFAATQHFSGSQSYPNSSIIYDVRGLSVASSFIVQNVVEEGMTFNPSGGFLYIANQSGNIIVLNPANHSIVGTVNSSYRFSSMTYDSKDGYIYAFFGNGSAGQMQVISGTKVTSSDLVAHTVTSVQYNVQYDNILAFY
jgi:hypothetical protein